MCNLESFKIDLKELNEGVNTFAFDLDDAFFAAIEAPEVSRGNVHVDVNIRRTADYFDIDFMVDGTVMVPCDVCLDDMEQHVESQNHLVAKFGEEYSEDDDLVTVPENEGVLDLTWFVYEFIALDIPIKHVHAPGKCNPAMIKALEELSATRSSDEDEETIDPRWSELEKLKKQ
jgi:uncharacterized metal-binding protein YceD (DUF177 family)